MNRSKSSGEPSSQKIFRYSLDLMLVMACALLPTSLAVWLGLSPSFVSQHTRSSIILRCRPFDSTSNSLGNASLSAVSSIIQSSSSGVLPSWLKERNRSCCSTTPRGREASLMLALESRAICFLSVSISFCMARRSLSV